jgi:2',3'-cyclic-nucleotide 2'-phosphodiesterase (5'-nucleotidase family)
MHKKYYSFIILFLSVNFYSCFHKTKIQHEVKHYEVSSNAIDSSVYLGILPYQKKIQDSMNQQIAEVVEPLIKETPEGNLGNFVCDALYKKHKDYLTDVNQQADFVLLNNGGLRTNIPSGNLIIGKVFELMPFDNELVIVSLDSVGMNEMVEFIAKKGGVPVSQLKLKIQNNFSTDVFVGNEIFNKQKKYKVLTSDYLVNGGDNMLFFKHATEKVLIKKLIRTVLIEYCLDETKKGNKISSKKDGRIQLSK